MTEIKYDHVLDGQGVCSCREFSMRPSAPGFTQAAAAHFIATTTEAVRQQTVWRGLINRLRHQ